MATIYIVKKSHFGRFDSIVLRDDTANTEVILVPSRGGTLVSFKNNDEEYIYLNGENFFDEAIPPERPRCGNPVLFPTVGLCEEDSFIFESEKYPMPIHGIVQHQKWEVINSDTREGASVTIEAKADEETKKQYPFDYSVQITYTLVKNKIYLRQKYINNGQGQMPFGFGFHPYFKVSNIKNLKWQIDAEGIKHKNEDEFVSVPKDIVLPYGTVSYTVFENAKNKASFIDTVYNTQVTVNFDEHFPNLLLWCLCDKGFICIEPWNTMPNTINTNPANILSKGQFLSAEISIEIDKKHIYD